MRDVVTDISKHVFMPLTVGGGIKTVDDMSALLKAGADKISLNSAALACPELISEGAQKFGNQCMVVAIDVKRIQRLVNGTCIPMAVASVAIGNPSVG